MDKYRVSSLNGSTTQTTAESGIVDNKDLQCPVAQSAGRAGILPKTQT